VLKKYIYVKKICKYGLVAIICCMCFIYAKKQYSNPDFGTTFGTKATKATKRLQNLNEGFTLCSKLCKETPLFLQALVFPEVMRYNTLKDGIETESLRTLYVQFGEEYANFSIGLFQMKPSFAMQVEEKAKQLLSDSIYKELQLTYEEEDAAAIREKRVDRLDDRDWQMIYLTAFICICKEVYHYKTFSTNIEKLQWFATVYNAGFDKTDSYLSKKIKEENFYLAQGMPDKKFKYAAIVSWYFNANSNK
jgi:hypothetical protein